MDLSPVGQCLRVFDFSAEHERDAFAAMLESAAAGYAFELLLGMKGRRGVSEKILNFY